MQDEATTQTLRLIAILCSCLELVVVAGHKVCPRMSREEVATRLQVLHSLAFALWCGFYCKLVCSTAAASGHPDDHVAQAQVLLLNFSFGAVCK